MTWSSSVGGPRGCAAAVAAARAGVRTLLLESGGFLGGTGARVLDTFYGFYAPGGEDRVLGGIGWEVCEALFERRLAFERPNTYGAGTGVTYEPDALKLVWEHLVAESGAALLLHALATAVIMSDSRLVGLIAETRAGPRRVTASIVVDASGDAEIAWRAGAAMDRSLAARHRQPGTATFRVGGVAADPAGKEDLHQAMQNAASGGYDLPRLEGSIHRTNLSGVWHVNMTRVAGYDVTDPWELTAAEIEGRRQVQEYARFLVERVDGYEDAYLLSTSTRLGIRETRRLLGRYVLTRDDVINARDFPDTIARCGAPLEDHAAGASTRWEYVGSGTQQPTGKTYGIPFRCLLPRDVEGLIVAGPSAAGRPAHAGCGRDVFTPVRPPVPGPAHGGARARGTEERHHVRHDQSDDRHDRGALRGRPHVGHPTRAGTHGRGAVDRWD